MPETMTHIDPIDRKLARKIARDIALMFEGDVDTNNSVQRYCIRHWMAVSIELEKLGYTITELEKAKVHRGLKRGGHQGRPTAAKSLRIVKP